MKKYGIIFMLLCLFTGCISDDHFIEEVMDEQRCAVSFTPALVAVATKAETPSSFLAKDTQVRIAAYLAPLSENEAASYSQTQIFNVSDAAGTLTPVGNALIVTNNFRYSFYAFSPASAFTDGKKTISVKQGDDFMIAQAPPSEVKGNSSTISLPVMSRKCSLVQFLVRLASGNVGLKNFTIGTGGLTLGGLTRTPVSYTLGDGDIKLDGIIKDGTATILGSAFEAKTVGSQYLGSSIVLPKLSGELSLSLNLVLSKGPVLLNAVIPAIAFAPGCNYLYMVEINDDVIKVCLVLDWNNSTSGFALGAPNAVIQVGSWGVTYPTTTTAGATNTTVAVTSWVGNANWAADLGASTSGGTVKGWTETTPTSTTVGSSNVTTTNTGWNASTSTHTTGTGTSAGTVTPWNSTTQTTSTTAGACNTTSTATTWNTSSSTHAAGAGAGAGAVTPWGPTFTTVTGIGE